MTRRVLRITSSLALLAGLTAACADDDATTLDTESGTSGTSTTTRTTGDASTTQIGSTGDSEGTTGESDTTGTTGELPPPPLEWTDECVAAGFDLTTLNPALVCTAIEVPLDWDTPDGEQILIAALRLPSTAGPRVGTFWALDGGPGGSGLGYLLDPGWADEIRAAGWDVVVPPHRGTFSPRLLCPGQVPASAACREALEDEWGDGLQHFNTKSAARDVGELVARERANPTEPAVVYGVSYGTYWAQFYAAENPDQADAIVLDSAVPTDADLAQEEYLVQDVAEKLLQACIDDPVCGARVEYDTGAAFSAAVIDAIDNGDCGIGDVGLWEDGVRRFEFGSLINSHRIRNYFPLLAAMLTRCDPDLTLIARDAINELFTASQTARRHVDEFPIGRSPSPSQDPPVAPLGGTPPIEVLFSGPLQAVVLSTTMLTPEADPHQAELDAERHIASLGFGTLMADVDDSWGDLPKVEFDRDFVSSTPLLVFNASYDLQTVLPWAEQVAAQHMQPLIEFADARHGVTLSGTGGKYPDGSSCARSVMLDFFADPSQPVDASCAGELPVVDVNIQREDLQTLSTTAFGTTDPWSLLPPLGG